MAAQKKRQEVARRVPPPARTGGAQLARPDEAIRLILEPLQRGEGFRHGAFGAPGYGKTTEIRHVLRAALSSGQIELIVTHDVKGAQSEFPEGTPLRSMSELTPDRMEALERTRHLVVRGDPLHDDEELPVEPVARAAQRLLRMNVATLLNLAELDVSVTDGGRSWTAPTVRWYSSQGRKLRGCLTWTTQQPKRCPDEIFDQSTTIAFYHLDVRSLNYLSSTLMLDPDMVAVLPRLARGEFALWVPGAEWNHQVYSFPPFPPPSRLELAA